MSFTGNTGNSTSTTANTNNNNNTNTPGNKVITPTTPTQSTADLSANKAIDQVPEDQSNKPDSTTPVTLEAGTSENQKK